MGIEIVLPLVIAISVFSLLVAGFLARQVLAADTGTAEMRARRQLAADLELVARGPVRREEMIQIGTGLGPRLPVP